MSGIFRVTRRDFLRGVGVGTGALVFGCYLSRDDLLVAELAKVKEILHDHLSMNPLVAIQPLDGTIIIVTHRQEMGQGIRSSLAAVLADELEADWSRVKLLQADADSLAYAVEFPFSVPGSQRYLIAGESAQFTEGSRSMAVYFQTMRLTGSSIRLVFERAAAKVLGVEASECRARQHKVYHERSGRSLDFGNAQLLEHAGKVAVPTFVEAVDALKKPAEWRFIGKSIPFVDARNMVTGKAEYGADLSFPGMLTAMIERCPVANGQLVSFDPTAALAVPGVRKVTAVLPPGLAPGGVGRAFVPHAGVAVLADNTWAALQGRRALRDHVTWDKGPNKDYESTAYREELERSTAAGGQFVRIKGDVERALGTAAKRFKAVYYIPLLAQAPMEPPTAVAMLKNDGLEVWAPTQNPGAAQQMAGRLAFGIPESEWDKEETIAKINKTVTVHLPLLGGAFGRGLFPDFVGEAALLAAQNHGVPIRVQWTREDDIQFSYYNAVDSQYLEAALDGDGYLTGLLWRSAFTSLFATLFPPSHAKERAALFNSGQDKYGSGIERAQGLEDMPYDVPNLRIENCRATNHIRIGCVRSGANVYHAFGICSFADELARAAGRDSKDYLLELIGNGRILPLQAEGVRFFDNNSLPIETISVSMPGGESLPVSAGFPPDTRRLRAVVERAAKESGWNEKQGKKGRGLGIAAHRSRLSYVAIVADVSLNDQNELTVNEIFGVIDCGLAVNRERVRAQMEGGIIYGLSYALLGEITAKDGAVVQNNFDDYRVLRMHQIPKKISIFIMDSDQPPSGVGEPPTPAVAPAVANAIVAAGGPRIREIPFFRSVGVR